MKYIICFTTAFLLSLFLTPLVRNLGIRVKRLHKSSGERWSKRRISKAGGIAIFIAFLSASLLFMPYNRISIGILLGGIVVFILGITDDFRNIKPYVKLIVQLIIASVIVSLRAESGIADKMLGPLGYIILITWIVGISNAFNLLDNMDGLAAGIAVIASVFLGLYSFLTGAGNMLLFFLLALSGASLGFLRYNFKPAKIYMGDSGSLLIGYLISVCSIMSTPKTTVNLFLILLVPSLILAVPIFDTFFVMVLRRLNNISLFQGGQDHTSHRVVKLGLTENKAVLLFYSVGIFFGSIGIAVLKFPFSHMQGLIIISVVTLIVFGLFLGRIPVYKSTGNGVFIKKSSKGINGGAILNTVFMHKRSFLEVFMDFFLIFAAYFFAFSLLYNYDYYLFQDVIARSFPVLVIVKLLVFSFMRLYKGIWQYFGVNDIISLFKASVTASVFSFVLLNPILGFDISLKVFVVDWMILFLLMEIIRGLERVFSHFFDASKPKYRRTLILGAGDIGEMALREMRKDRSFGREIVGFVDNDEVKKEKYIDGVKILGDYGSIQKIAKEENIDEIIIADKHISDDILNKVSITCWDYNIRCRRAKRLFFE